jgi:predicted ATP-grasp superfamily ATP-dependent carboligase
MSTLKKLFESEQPVAVVYPSYSINSYGVIRALGEQGIPVLALDDVDSPHMRSRYVESMICPSATSETEKFIAFLTEIGAKFRTPPVLYMMEDVYYYLAHEYRELLEPRFRFPYMAHAAMLDCIDKQRSFERLAMADPGIPLPGTWYPTTHAELNAIKADVTFPVVLKPLVSRFDFREGGIDKVMEFPQLFNNKAVQAESWEELVAHFTLVERHGIPCCVQELIPGGQDALVGATLYVDAQGQVHGNFTYSKLRQTPWDFGTMTLGRAIEAPEVAALSERVVKALNFTGICGIEFKYDARDGRYKFIEINPRGELWMNLAQHCGVNLPLLKYQDLIGQPQRATQTRFDKHLIDLRDDFSLYFMRYRHHRGAAYRLSLREWLASVLQPGKMEEVVFNWRDPKPGLLRFKEYATRVLAHRLPLPAKTPPRVVEAPAPEQQRPAA